jgi:hypothetical protein
MIDIDITLAVLRVLAVNSGSGPITEENVALGYEARTHKPAYAGRIRQGLEECKRQRWAEETQDEWGRPCWIVTAAGKERNSL